MDNDETKPPSRMDFASRRIPATGVFRREERRHPFRVDAVCLIHGARLGRRSINLPYIRAEGQS